MSLENTGKFEEMLKNDHVLVAQKKRMTLNEMKNIAGGGLGLQSNYFNTFKHSRRVNNEKAQMIKNSKCSKSSDGKHNFVKDGTTTVICYWLSKEVPHMKCTHCGASYTAEY